MQLQLWIAQQPNAKHCPTPDCPFVFLNDCEQGPITCPSCNKTYCALCLFEHDKKISCGPHFACLPIQPLFFLRHPMKNRSACMCKPCQRLEIYLFQTSTAYWCPCPSEVQTMMDSRCLYLLDGM